MGIDKSRHVEAIGSESTTMLSFLSFRTICISYATINVFAQL